MNQHINVQNSSQEGAVFGIFFGRWVIMLSTTSFVLEKMVNEQHYSAGGHPLVFPVYHKACFLL